MNKVKTPLGEAYALSENIVKSITLVAQLNDLEVVKEHVKAIREAFSDNNYYISDTRFVKHTSIEVRRYLAANTRAKAVAILAKSGPAVLLSNIFISFNRLPYPIKLFKEEADAIAWLVEQGAEAPKN